MWSAERIDRPQRGPEGGDDLLALKQAAHEVLAVLSAQGGGPFPPRWGEAALATLEHLARHPVAGGIRKPFLRRGLPVLRQLPQADRGLGQPIVDEREPGLDTGGHGQSVALVEAVAEQVGLHQQVGHLKVGPLRQRGKREDSRGIGARHGLAQPVTGNHVFGPKCLPPIRPLIPEHHSARRRSPIAPQCGKALAQPEPSKCPIEGSRVRERRSRESHVIHRPDAPIKELPLPDGMPHGAQGPWVSPEQLVPAVSHHEHTESFGVDCPNQCPVSGPADVGERIVSLDAHVGEVAHHVLGADGHAVMRNSEVSREIHRHRGLVVAIVARVADRERVHRHLRVRRGHRGNEAAVDATGECNGDGHVRPDDQPPHVLQHRQNGVARCRIDRCRFQERPPAAFLHGLRREVDIQQAACAQLPRAFDRRRRLGHESPCQVIVYRGGVHPKGHRARCHQCTQFAGEDDAPIALGQVERLLPQSISCEQQPTLPEVEDGHREHATQPLQHLGPVFLPEMNDHLAVAVGRETVPALAQFIAELAIVVDLPVDHRRHGAVLVPQRLHPAMQVDDGETPHADLRARLLGATSAVRSPVHERGGQRIQQSLAAVPYAGEFYQSVDAAHAGASVSGTIRTMAAG